MRNLILRSAALALIFGTPAFALAQTADGIGGRTDAGTPPDAEETADQIDSLIDLAEYQPRFYQVAGRVWGIMTPDFALDGFLDAHTNMWTQGVTNFSYGLEFTTRIPDKYDLVVGLDYANLHTPDGFWLEDGDQIDEADFGVNTLSLINADVSFHWLANLDKRDSWQVYGGFGLGAGIKLGHFYKYDIDVQQCGFTEEERRSYDTSLLGRCRDENGGEFPHDPTSREEQSGIPPVIPALSATGGLRYLFGDHYAVSVEGGFKAIYFYTGLEFGYFWRPLPRAR
jgi:hypothetical protein